MNIETNLFKLTDSKMTNAQKKDSKPPQRGYKYANLLDMLDQKNDVNGQIDEIQTFDQFMQVVNNFDFQKNQRFQARPARKQSFMLRPRYQLSLKENNFENKKNLALQRTASIDADTNDKETDGNNLMPNNFLKSIREQLYSRGSAKMNEIQNKNNLNTGLNLTSHIHLDSFYRSKQPKKQQENDNGSGSIFRSSAHSSRSFNGLQQINQYQIQKQIGSGGFAKVMLCVNVNTQQKYAMKVMTIKDLRRKLFSKNSQQLADYYINNEIALLKKMVHPHIVRLYEVIDDEPKNKIYLILEYCSGGFINQYEGGLYDSKKFQGNYIKLLQSQCKRYFRQLCLAIDYIHNVAKIAHRDIKPENILLSQKDEVKLSDFGLGTQDIEVASKSGTRGYLPPECRNPASTTSIITNLLVSPPAVETPASPVSSISGNPRDLLSIGTPSTPWGGRRAPRVTTQMADIWAIGVTLLVCLQGKHQEIQDDKIQSVIMGVKDISDQCKDFINRCLKINPFQRITAEEMIEHPWIRGKKNSSYDEIKITEQQKSAAIVHRNKPTDS